MSFQSIPLSLLLLIGSLGGSLAWAQQTAPQPAAPAPPAPPPTLVEMIDFPHYAADDARLSAAPVPQPRVVLMGDSITEGWKRADPGLFADDHYIDRGISGQTTLQMLLRFRPDVIDLHPSVLVLLGGANDIAQNTGVETLAMIEGNLASMAELAQAHRIAVVLCSITPADRVPWNPRILPAADIHALNEWLRAYASAHGLVYLDYYSVLVAPGSAAMPPELSADGVHPTPAGYAIMRPLMEKAAKQALEARKK